jgi:hypothetical protein
MGDAAARTVFRKLKGLGYVSSYSHRGKYYTLRMIAKFDEQGLWNHEEIWFSVFGKLLETAQAFVERSDVGYTASELRGELHVKTKHALVDLVRRGRLSREEYGTGYAYFAAERRRASQQGRARQKRDEQCATPFIVSNPDLAVEEAKALVVLFYSLLNEKQRRLYAGLESLKLGHGGDVHMAALLGMNPHTVARGREELMAGDFSDDRIREPGGGRKAVEKKRPKSSKS